MRFPWESFPFFPFPIFTVIYYCSTPQTMISSGDIKDSSERMALCRTKKEKDVYIFEANEWLKTDWHWCGGHQGIFWVREGRARWCHVKTNEKQRAPCLFPSISLSLLLSLPFYTQDDTDGRTQRAFPVQCCCVPSSSGSVSARSLDVVETAWSPFAFRPQQFSN